MVVAFHDPFILRDIIKVSRYISIDIRPVPSHNAGFSATEVTLLRSRLGRGWGGALTAAAALCRGAVRRRCACRSYRKDSMAEQPSSPIIRYPSDAEVRAHFEAYVAAVGKVAHAWNYLHERLGHLFVTIIDAPNRDVSVAVWYSPFADRVQRDMLQATIEAMPEYRWHNQPPQAKADLLDVLKEISALGFKRDDAIHAPASLYTDVKGAEMAASFLSRHRRARNLAGKSLLVEFDWCERYAEALSRFIDQARHALAFGGVRWPDKTHKPTRKAKKDLQGP
jgi:hypothetical protein